MLGNNVGDGYGVFTGRPRRRTLMQTAPVRGSVMVVANDRIGLS